MLGGNDFVAAIFNKIKEINTLDLTSCSSLKREKMERQFWEKATDVTRTFSLEGTDTCGIEIENLVNTTDDMFFNYDFLDNDIKDCWASLYEEYDRFIEGFIKKHENDTVTSCEIVGNSLRIPTLKNLLNKHLQLILIDRYSNTMNMDNAVNRGLAFIGNSISSKNPDQVMKLSKQSISLEYTIEDNKKQEKELQILGCNHMEPEAGKLVVSLENCYTLEKGNDHNWSGILEDYRKMTFLNPNVATGSEEAIDDSDDEVDEVVKKENEEGEVDEVVNKENEEEEVDEVVTLESNSLNQHGENSFFQQRVVLPEGGVSTVSEDNDAEESMNNYQDNISQGSNDAVDDHNTRSFGSFNRGSHMRKSIVGTSRYSTVPQDDSTVIEINGTYQVQASQKKERHPIKHIESKKEYGFAFTENYNLSGEYKLYFDENQTILKEEGYYVNNKRNGDFKHYFNNEKHSLKMKRHYNDGNVSGYTISYTEDGQYETISWYGDHNVERKRWEFKTGILKRYSERDVNPKKWRVVEFDNYHYVKAIGFANRDLKDNKYIYTMSGNCYLYAKNKYQMHGFYQNDEITVDDLLDSNTYSVMDCYNMIVHEDGKKLKCYCKDNKSPWKKIPTDYKKDKKDKNHEPKNISFKMNGQKQLFREKKVYKEKNGDEEKVVEKIYSVLGYLWMKVERKKGSYSVTKYYPFFEDGKEYKTELFTIHPSMKEIYDHSLVASYEEYDSNNKCIKEEKYSNVGIKL